MALKIEPKMKIKNKRRSHKDIQINLILFGHLMIMDILFPSSDEVRSSRHSEELSSIIGVVFHDNAMARQFTGWSLFIVSGRQFRYFYQ